MPRRLAKNQTLEDGRKLIYAISEKEKIEFPDEWYKLKLKQLVKHGGKDLLTKTEQISSGDKLRNLLGKLYPEHKKLFYSPDDKNDHQTFFNQLKKKYNIKKKEEFLKLTKKQITTEYGGNKILQQYNNSIKDAIENIYSTKLEINKEKRKKNYWKNGENQKQFLEDAFKKLNLNDIEEWKNVQKSQISLLGGRGLFNIHPNFYSLISTNYPEISWKIFEFSIVPKGFWKKKENQFEFLKYIEKKLEINKEEDWYSISADEFKEFKGAEQIIKIYGSFTNFLFEFYPNFSWNIFKFSRLPNNFWKIEDNQNKFFTLLKNELNLNSEQDYFNISADQIKSYGGSGLIHYFSNLNEFRQRLYDFVENSATENKEKNKNKIIKKRKTRNYWEDQENIKKFIEELKVKYSIKNEEDWYRVSLKQIRSTPGGGGILNKHQSLYNILTIYYSSSSSKFKLDYMKFKKRDKKSIQRWLFLQLEKLYPQQEMIENYIHPIQRVSNSIFEFDVFIPAFSFAFEYQGEHHYQDIPAFGPVELYRSRDLEKLEFCKNNNIHLIIIPFWWDLSLDSLSLLIVRSLAI